MKHTSREPYWWDWTSIVLLFMLLQVTVSRLIATEWTDDLNFTQVFTTMGFVIGAALGYSQFKRNTSRWISFGYMVFMLPLVWIRVVDEQVDLNERLLSVGGRLLNSIIEFFARKPVEDPLFFVAIMSIVFWILSASAGFTLTRQQNFMAIILPSMVSILVIQQYDNLMPGRVWFLGLFTFLALFLLGRLNFLHDQKQWREKRVFFSSENSLDLTNSAAIAAGAIILFAWMMPISLPRAESIRETWKQIIHPWTEFTQRFENAVSALESPSPGTSTEFYGAELNLGRGFPLSDAVILKINAPELSSDEKPPRYYWRGRTYDLYINNQWQNSNTLTTDYSPIDSSPLVSGQTNSPPVRFNFVIGGSKSSLLYAPAQPVWFSRPGSYLAISNDATKDITSWHSSPALLPGETYQAEAILNNPHVEELRQAGTQYPSWITEKYLQIPENFSPRIQTLAQDITLNASTPYDKAVAITNYLRANIEYAPTIPEPPRNSDPLEWVLFEYKQAYCVYYATAEVMMLRSLGIPARMAVGFAQGTRVVDEQPGEVEDTATDSFTVQKKNAHAWPEVYFPDIGWVEFEPTGNQSPLDRPLLARESNDLNNNGLIRNLPLAEDELTNRDPGLDESTSTSTGQSTRIPPSLYLILILMFFTSLTIYLARRYNVPARVPVLIRSTMQRNGIDVPDWIIRWENWSGLSVVERSFESVNFGLRRVKQPAPIYATPAERAQKLSSILPNLEPQIKVLLDEHQTSLYTSRVADEKKARRAANQIRMQVVISLLRHLLTGQYETPAK